VVNIHFYYVNMTIDHKHDKFSEELNDTCFTLMSQFTW
jgi:hypothetical protein